MGMLDFLKKKDEARTEEKPQKQAPKTAEPEGETETGFNEECALCGKGGTNKKWAGQYWHKRCLRSSRKAVKGMI